MRLRIEMIVLIVVLGAAACSKPPKPADVPASLKFSIPPDWIREDPSSTRQHSRYRLPHAAKDSEDAELTITFSGDQDAPIQKTMDAWTAQFEKPDGGATSANVLRRETNGIPVTILDATGTYFPQEGGNRKGKPGFRMLAAIAETEQGPWFFRLTGPAETVALWEPSFQSFLETIEY